MRSLPVWLLTGCDIGTACARYETIRLTTIRNAPKLHPQFTIIGHFNFTQNGSIVTFHILHFPGFEIIQFYDETRKETSGPDQSFSEGDLKHQKYQIEL